MEYVHFFYFHCCLCQLCLYFGIIVVIPRSVNIVLKQAQYILIHQALLEHNQFGETEIPVAELPSTLSTLREKNSESELTLMEEEYEVQETFVFSLSATYVIY